MLLVHPLRALICEWCFIVINTQAIVRVIYDKNITLRGLPPALGVLLGCMGLGFRIQEGWPVEIIRTWGRKVELRGEGAWKFEPKSVREGRRGVGAWSILGSSWYVLGAFECQSCFGEFCIRFGGLRFVLLLVCYGAFECFSQLCTSFGSLQSLSLLAGGGGYAPCGRATKPRRFLLIVDIGTV